MSVGQYALTSLEEAKTYLGNVPEKDGIWIYCSASDATAATVRVTPTTIVMIITGGGNAGTTTLTFADADKNSLSELVTAINATTGWAAGAVYHGDADSTDLVVTGTLSCLGVANETTLKIEDNYLIEALIDRATDIIERYTCRKLDSRTYTHERYWGNGTSHLILDNYPVTRVSAVKEGRTAAFTIENTNATSSAYVEVTGTLVRLTRDGTTTDITIASYDTITLLIAAIEAVSGWDCVLSHADYGAKKSSEILPNHGGRYCLNETVDVEIADDYCDEYYLEGGVDEVRGTGILYNSDGWQRDTEYWITYTAGYTTIPYVLEMACLELVKHKWNALEASGPYKSESIGDYSYTLADFSKGLPDEIRAELDLFKRRMI